MAHVRSPQGRKQLRYAGVSLVFVPVGQVLVQFFHWALDWPDPLAVLVTAMILTVPNYLANKLYVWKYTSKENIRTQVLVFWVAAMLGTAFAMTFVTVADAITVNSNAVVQALALFCSQLLGYGIVWVARYIFLDKWLFKVSNHDVEPTPGQLGELHQDFPV